MRAANMQNKEEILQLRVIQRNNLLHPELEPKLQAKRILWNIPGLNTLGLFPGVIILLQLQSLILP